MPKLNNRPPKYTKVNGRAAVYYGGKTHYLGGLYGSQESKAAYARFLVEIQANPDARKPNEERSITVSELAVEYLDFAVAKIDPTDYGHCRVIVLDFLTKLFGSTPVGEFKPQSLKTVRNAMIQSRRFCRSTVNKYTKHLISMFSWGVEHDLVPETIWRALKTVKALSKGYEGTFDHEEREPVPDDVISRTLPFMPPMLRAMVIVQRLTGCRPNEIYKMRVGDIDTTRGDGLWYYVPNSYKTSVFVGKIVFPLGKPEQELIAPYLEGKSSEQAVFSPATAIAERNAEKRANRKTKVSPSQAARDEKRAMKSSRYSEFYDHRSYRQAILHAITKGNKTLPDGEQIPHWYPYLLRNSAATATELEHSDEDAQALLGHKTVNMTKRYSKTQLKRREVMARNRRNPFESDSKDDAE